MQKRSEGHSFTTVHDVVDESRGGHHQPCRVSLSSAFVTSPLKGVTGLTSWSSHEAAKGTEWYLFFDLEPIQNGSRPSLKRK